MPDKPQHRGGSHPDNARQITEIFRHLFPFPEVYCIHFSAHVSEAQDVSFDHGSVSVEGLAETHGNGILQLCTTHFDHIDKKIIGMLQENARTPIKEIAKEVYLSSPAVSARISRLEIEGTLSEKGILYIYPVCPKCN